MAFTWSESSLAAYNTCTAPLQQVADRALELGVVDIVFMEGLRGKAAQNDMHRLNKSKLLWPFGKHNVYQGNGGSDAPNIETLTRIANPTYPGGKMHVEPDAYRRLCNLIEEAPNGKVCAMDIAPYFNDGRRIPWDDVFTWNTFGGFIVAVGATLGVPLRWGGDWDGDWTNKDQGFHDLPHFELTGE